MSKRKKYPYKNKMLTVKELFEHKDCKVTLRELQCNLWKRKMPTELAISTPKLKRREKANKRYFYHGLMLTFNELAELEQCRVSPYTLRVLLRKGVPIDLALVGIDKIPEVEFDMTKKRKKEIEKRKKDNVKFIKKFCNTAGGSISFSPPQNNFTKLHEYNYIVCRDRFGLEVDENGLNMKKYIEKYTDIIDNS